MHEAGLVGHALDAALPAGRPISAVTLEILDPFSVAEESAAFYLELALRDRGLEGVPFRVSVAAQTCVHCGAVSEPGDREPLCPSCGWPRLPDGGPPLRVRVTEG
jgi:Zn finger protein HypA/HybF involved in hydrogenase expression